MVFMNYFEGKKEYCQKQSVARGHIANILYSFLKQIHETKYPKTNQNKNEHFNCLHMD